EPTAVPAFTVTFRAGEDILSETSVLMGEHPTLPTYESSEFVIVGWETAVGETVSPAQTAVTADSEYRAILRPALRSDVRFVYADKCGLFRPENQWSRADAARALYALMPETPEERLELPDVATDAVYPYDQSNSYEYLNHTYGCYATRL
ncbi:MAG: hypothetical protein IJB56_01800, partial [Alistipes sp.]|nr:hypothetical protein [Alistipes sp.]